ncbi:MAG: NrpR regulatory domain-containing protein [Treponema sp.]|nr:NrpR regulatory domain-containing protein [Treponema sp.]
MEAESQKAKELAILGLLDENERPLSGADLEALLRDKGYELSERTIRLYLQRFDAEGLTESLGKQGRKITDKGRMKLDEQRLMHRVGYMSARIDQMTYTMDFDLPRRKGTVVINLAIIKKDDFLVYLPMVEQVFEKGYAMGTLVSIVGPGERIGAYVIPEEHIGFCTVCSVTLNGVFLKYGIPTRSLFSGLLHLEQGQAVRFVELISYDGTSIDPLQLFIRGKMTDYLGAIKDGNGRIGAGFREIPGESYQLAMDLARQLQDIGLGAFLKIGRPSRDLLNVPVHEGCCGLIVIGGLNPVAVFEESGIPVSYNALAGYMEFNRLFHYSQMRERLGL